MKIKILNLNIWLGGKLFDSALRFIREENPDLLLLQEVYDGKSENLPRNLRTTDVLKEELDLEYYYFSPSMLDNLKEGKIGRGNAIFSRFSIKEKNTFFFDRPYGEYSEYNSEDFAFFPKNLQHIEVEINKKLFNIFNTQGIWGLDGRDNARRLKMSKTIVNTIKDKKNVVLAGDFNLQPDTVTIQNIEKYLRNVFKNELTSSFNMKRKTNPGYATAVVDMLFASRNLKVVDHYCPQIDVSDHLPLVCVIEV